MLAATIQAPNLLGYYYGMLAIAKDFTALKRGLAEIANRTYGMWETMGEAAMDAQGLQRGGPKERLWFYRGGDWVRDPATGQMVQTGKTDQMWAHQQASYPRDFVRDMSDFESLLLKETNGDL